MNARFDAPATSGRGAVQGLVSPRRPRWWKPGGRVQALHADVARVMDLGLFAGRLFGRSPRCLPQAAPVIVPRRRTLDRRW